MSTEHRGHDVGPSRAALTYLLAALLAAVVWGVATIALAALISGAVAPLGTREVAVLAVVVAVAVVAWVSRGLTRRRHHSRETAARADPDGSYAGSRGPRRR